MWENGHVAPALGILAKAHLRRLLRLRQASPTSRDYIRLGLLVFFVVLLAFSTRAMVTGLGLEIAGSTHSVEIVIALILSYVNAFLIVGLLGSSTDELSVTRSIALTPLPNNVARLSIVLSLFFTVVAADLVLIPGLVAIAQSFIEAPVRSLLLLFVTSGMGGVVLGVMVALLARTLARPLRRGTAPAYPLSLAVLVAYAALAFRMSAHQMGQSSVLHVLFPYLTPSSFPGEASSFTGQLLQVGTSLVLLFGAFAAWALFGGGWESRSSRRAALEWNGRSGLLLLQAVRIWRLPRFWGSAAALTVIALSSVVSLHFVGAPERDPLGSVLIFVVGCMASHLGLVASSSSMDPQIEHYLNLPQRSVSLYRPLAAMTGLVPSVFVFAGYSLMHEIAPSYLMFLSGVGGLGVVLGAALGRAGRAEPNDPGTEVGVLFAVSALEYGGLLLVGKLVETPWGLGAYFCLFACTLAFLDVFMVTRVRSALESRRFATI